MMATARQQPVWRKNDRSPGDSSGLVDPLHSWEFEGLRNARFADVDHGKVEWDVDGETYVKQALPTHLQNLTYSPEMLVAEMDYAGVDMALLHRTPYMSKSNKYIAECVQAFPERLQGLAYVEDWLIPTKPDASIAKLDHAINVLGLHGYQFMRHHLDLYGVNDPWDGPRFSPFWDAVESLGIPVFFTLGADTYESYLDEMKRLRRWMERYPDVVVVQTHGFNWRLFSDGTSLEVPDEVYDAAPTDHPNYHIQLLFAVFLQRCWSYPLSEVLPTLEQMWQRMGPSKLIWGTDIPVSLLWWTYRQNLEYIASYAEFLPSSEMELILGGNMKRIMGLG